MGRHEEVRLVFVGRWIGRARLHGLGQAGKVKLVRISLSVYFRHDVLVVVIAQCPAELVVVHVGLALTLAPPPRGLIRVYELELAVGSLPRDAARVAAV